LFTALNSFSICLRSVMSSPILVVPNFGHKSRKPVHTDHFIVAVPGQLEQKIAAEGNATIQIEQDRNQFNVFQCLAETSFSFLQRFFRFLSHCNLFFNSLRHVIKYSGKAAQLICPTCVTCARAEITPRKVLCGVFQCFDRTEGRITILLKRIAITKPAPAPSAPAASALTSGSKACA